jgi:hypothetical protein
VGRLRPLLLVAPLGLLGELHRPRLAGWVRAKMDRMFVATNTRVRMGATQ